MAVLFFVLQSKFCNHLDTCSYSRLDARAFTVVILTRGHVPLCRQVRPRGWHLWEKHLLVDGRPVPGGIFDFALYFFHNAGALREAGSGPYFYLPKMQSHLEARLWNDVFLDAQVRKDPCFPGARRSLVLQVLH